jgi:methylglutaconyl-CoA hydratase
MDPEYTRLRLERDGAVTSVVLNRPEIHDAFDDVTILELSEVFTTLGDDASTRVILLRSTGKHFSAGADLNWMRRIADYSEAENREDARTLEGMFRAIATCPKPVVARVQGAALGGGSGLVATADIAVATTRASFGFTEARLGILPAVISPYVLKKLHWGQAQALFLTGERFRADKALRLGLVAEVVEEEDLDTAVAAVIADLLACSPGSQARIKELIPKIAHLEFEEAAGHTVDSITAARAEADGKAGMAAFLNKESAPWIEDAE